jgi:hypothetical protein
VPTPAAVFRHSGPERGLTLEAKRLQNRTEMMRWILNPEGQASPQLGLPPRREKHPQPTPLQ